MGFTRHPPGFRYAIMGISDQFLNERLTREKYHARRLFVVTSTTPF